MSHHARNTFLTATQLGVNYVRYFFLTWAAAFYVGSILLLFFSVGVNPSTEFLSHLTFLNPVFGEETMRLGINEIMQVFSFIALILWLTSSVFRYLLKDKWPFKKMKNKKKLLYFWAGTTALYLAAGIFFKIAWKAEDSLKVFSVFYMINMIAITGFLILGFLNEKLEKLKSPIE